MKKRIKDMIIAIEAMALVCVGLWYMNFIYSWREVRLLYALLAVVLVIREVIHIVRRRLRR